MVEEGLVAWGRISRKEYSTKQVKYTRKTLAVECVLATCQWEFGTLQTRSISFVGILRNDQIGKLLNSADKNSKSDS